MTWQLEEVRSLGTNIICFCLQDRTLARFGELLGCFIVSFIGILLFHLRKQLEFWDVLHHYCLAGPSTAYQRKLRRRVSSFDQLSEHLDYNNT